MSTNREIKSDGAINISSTQTNVSGDLDVTGSINNFTFPGSDGLAGQALTTNGSGTLSFSDVAGGGAGGINYITNTRATADATGYAVYADAAATIPVDGTGGSANITFTRNTTNPLRDGGDFKIAKDAANRQGEGVGNAFTIDNADKAKKMLISFDYDASDSDYADDDIKIFIYDVTNTNLIRINGEDLKGGKGKHFATFQTAPDSTSYRLIFHISSTNAAAYDVFLDEISVSPIGVTSSVSTKSIFVVGSGSPGTYTITPASERIPFTIVEDSSGSMSTSDNGPDTFTAPEGGSYTIEGNISTSLSTVTTQTVDAYINGTLSRSLQSSDSATDRYKHFSGIVRLNKGDVLDFRFSSGADVEVQSSTTHHWIHIEKIPDLSLPESIGSANDIIGSFHLSGNQTISTNSTTKIQFDTIETDTAGSFTVSSSTDYSTGFYTIPETGFYDVSVQLEFDNVQAGDRQKLVLIKANDSSVIATTSLRAQSTADTDTEHVSLNATFNFTKGDKIAVASDTDSDTSYLVEATSSNVDTWFKIAKRQSAQVALGASPDAFVIATTNAGQDIPNATATTVVYEDKTVDTLGAYNTSTGVFTAKLTGFYQVNAQILFVSATGFDTDELLYIQLFKNGSLHLTGSVTEAIISNSQSVHYGSRISAVVNCDIGDTIEVKVYQTAGHNVVLLDEGDDNHLSIYKIN